MGEVDDNRADAGAVADLAEALSGWWVRGRLADAEALEQGLYASLDRRADTDLSACVERTITENTKATHT
ncbi:hypothetical protein [Streptomyces sp. NPDC002640]